ncbi:MULTISPECIES: CbtB-domain containing protein [unclassified Caballeronia]|uniref:CbtB domain-containing protein n=1 Tax=unclassified Caballeronia TaxID=2646786 RepID=UPI00285F7E7B|nr:MULTISPECIES: CbtB-domain containing protein [unclassified Caballeronia]MDR5739361.1 CbtB-domain containing protein [Caballeronia sp. LZ016]MDR5807850.1 CbtB-domain containing protein [Caballeronia sp. LZ019]
MNASNATACSAAPSLPAIDAPAPIPVREVLPWAVFIGLILLIAIYFVGAEQGATSILSGTYVHEFVHDGRHLLGFPCH